MAFKTHFHGRAKEGQRGSRGPGRPRPPGSNGSKRGSGRERPSAAPAPGGRLWLFGLHPVLSALANPERICQRLLVTEEVSARQGERLAAALAARGGTPSPERTDRRALDTLLRGAVHQGIALEAEPLAETFLTDILVRAESKAESLLVLLDQVTDPHNVGAILRSAAAFGADGVVTTERHAPGETATMAKAAAGALDLVPLVRVGNLARAMTDLRQAGFCLIGLDGAAPASIADVPVPAKRALVLGAEGPGMRRLTRDSCDLLARIPMVERAYGGGALDSLNVSNAAAVALFALARPRG